MSEYNVVLTPNALIDIQNIYDYISERNTTDMAWEYIQTIKNKSDNLKEYPLRGINRDNIRAGLRLLVIDKKSIIAYEVNEKNKLVTILNIFYGGQDYKILLEE